jgi:dTDP-glucose 4,6-dehydratase
MVFHKGKSGEVYNIGGRNEQKNIDIINKLIRIVSIKTESPPENLSKLITFVKDRPGHDRRYAIDPSKMEKELGWTPATGFEEGLSDTVGWYLANRPWWSRILSGQYMDYYKLQYGEKIS